MTIQQEVRQGLLMVLLGLLAGLAICGLLVAYGVRAVA